MAKKQVAVQAATQEVQSTTQTCSLETVLEVTRHHLKQLWANPEQAKTIPPLMLWGPPGVGKSTVVADLCAEEGIEFKDVRLAQREPIDIRGLPVPQDGVVHWLLPAEWPTEPNSRGIILFDELTSADRTMQVAAYEFILDRKLGDIYRVPPGWYVMAAGNRTSDRAVATTMSSALANRFCHLDVAPDLEVWIRWAQHKGLHPDVLAFLRYRPNLFHNMEGNLERGWPSPRSWERVALELQLSEGLGDTALRTVLMGLVGPGATVEFLAFRQTALALPDVLDVFKGTKRFVTPVRADQKYAVCMAVSYHMWQYKDRARALETLYDIGQLLPSDFASMLMMDVLHTKGSAMGAVLGHQRFQAWSKQHGTAFSERMKSSNQRLVA
jgi:DNA polymerase III delta prime subunit